MPAYEASCHCKNVRFRFESEPITKGLRCNCSICVRQGAVKSDRYYKPDELSAIEGELRVYQFGDRSLEHAFCPTCGVWPFSVVTSLPEGYTGSARVGDRRINLGCVHDLDVFALEIRQVDGRSF